MSPNPGEPDHETRGWTHSQCITCWSIRNPSQTPTMVMSDATVPCCYCGTLTRAGIYVRQSALEVHTPMTWTSDRPATPGWYWIDTGNGQQGVYMAYIANDRVHCYFLGDDPQPLTVVMRFQGPVAEPPV